MAVRKERIPVRGLKRVSRVDQDLQFRVVRKERIPVRGLKLQVVAMLDDLVDLSERNESP